MIHVIATVDLQPGKRDAFLAEFRKIISAVKAEAGCVEYVPTVDAETDLPNHARMGPDRVVIIEKWETLAHLKAHAVAPHMQAYRPKVKDFVKSMELRVLLPA
jgi:quinol monooxygenase YgiN